MVQYTCSCVSAGCFAASPSAHDAPDLVEMKSAVRKAIFFHHFFSPYRFPQFCRHTAYKNNYNIPRKSHCFASIVCKRYLLPPYNFCCVPVRWGTPLPNWFLIPNFNTFSIKGSKREQSCCFGIWGIFQLAFIHQIAFNYLKCMKIGVKIGFGAKSSRFAGRRSGNGRRGWLALYETMNCGKVISSRAVVDFFSIDRAHTRKRCNTQTYLLISKIKTHTHTHIHT